MSFGTDDGRVASRDVVDAIDRAYARGVVLVAAAADKPVREQGAPANILQPRGTAPDITAGKGLTVTAATSDDVRAPFAGRGSEISLAAYGAVAGGSRVAGPARRVPLELDGPRARRDEGPPGRLRMPHELPRRQPLRLPGGHVDGRAPGRGDGRAHAPDEPRPEGRRHHPPAEAHRPPAAPDGAGRRSSAGGSSTPTRRCSRARSLDRSAPTSQVVLAAPVSGGSVALRWRGQDGSPPGVRSTGIARYEVWRKAGEAPAQRMTTTTSTSALIPAEPGVRNQWFTVAVDRQGNRERRRL